MKKIQKQTKKRNKKQTKKNESGQNRCCLWILQMTTTMISFIQPYVQSYLYSTVDYSCIIVTRTSHVQCNYSLECLCFHTPSPCFHPHPAHAINPPPPLSPPPSDIVTLPFGAVECPAIRALTHAPPLPPDAHPPPLLFSLHTKCNIQTLLIVIFFLN